MEPHDIFWVVVAMAAAGMAALALIVGGDLGPAARLRRPHAFLLAAGLGLGVISVALKAVAIQVLAAGLGHPPALSAPPRPVPAAAAVATLPEEPAATGLTWNALPDSSRPPAASEAALRALGARLFHDPALSKDGSLSCASCHDPRLGGADGRRTARGIGGQTGARNTPSVFNTAFQTRFFWDGRARSLEAQALGPILNPIEMGNASMDGVAARIAADRSYAPLLTRAFGPGAGASPGRIAAALAAYQRGLVTADAPYDRFLAGAPDALTPQQLRGMWLFQSVGCVTCHSGANFSRASRLAPDHGASALRIFPIHLTDYAARYGLTADLGAARAGRHGVWRVPSLRNVELTAPYFHNGSVDTLEEAVRVMAASQLDLRVEEAGATRPSVRWVPEARRLDGHVRRSLSRADVDDIAAFLRALTSDRLRALASQALPAGGAAPRP